MRGRLRWPKSSRTNPKLRLLDEWATASDRSRAEVLRLMRGLLVYGFKAPELAKEMAEHHASDPWETLHAMRRRARGTGA